MLVPVVYEYLNISVVSEHNTILYEFSELNVPFDLKVVSD